MLYNIRDVWSQYLIDFVTNDTKSLIYDMNQHNCPLHYLVKQTKYQKQIYYAGYLRRGFVPGHNVNVHYTRFESEEEEEAANEARKRRQLRELLDKQGFDEDDIADAMESGEDAVNSLLEVGTTKTDEESELIGVVESEAAIAVDENLVIFEDSTERRLPLPGGLVGNPNNNSANGTELISGVQSKHVFDEVMGGDSCQVPFQLAQHHQLPLLGREGGREESS